MIEMNVKDKVVTGFMTLGIGTAILYGLIYNNEEAVVFGVGAAIVFSVLVMVFG